MASAVGLISTVLGIGALLNNLASNIGKNILLKTLQDQGLKAAIKLAVNMVISKVTQNAVYYALKATLIVAQYAIDNKIKNAKDALDAAKHEYQKLHDAEKQREASIYRDLGRDLIALQGAPLSQEWSQLSPDENCYEPDRYTYVLGNIQRGHLSGAGKSDWYRKTYADENPYENGSYERQA